MPQDVALSSNEEEEASAGAAARGTEKVSKFSCPADFACFRPRPCSSTLASRLKKHQGELWLIKAPASFNPARFSAVEVPLAGLQTLTVPAAAPPDGPPQTYSVLASAAVAPELRLLTSKRRRSEAVTFGPAFAGLIDICESYHGDGEGAPQVIPAAPPPAIPAGLKQRFHPFGSKTPTLTCVAESEADGAAFGPSSTTLRPLVVKRFVEEAEEEEEEDDGRRRKKKKKRLKAEAMEQLVAVKQEPEDAVAPDDDGVPDEPMMAEKRRKKKKKKEDRERAEVEAGLEPSLMVKVEDVSVKAEVMELMEVMEACCHDDDAAGKKKKKKKKKSRNHDEDV